LSFRSEARNLFLSFCSAVIPPALRTAKSTRGVDASDCHPEQRLALIAHSREARARAVVEGSLLGVSLSVAYRAPSGSAVAFSSVGFSLRQRNFAFRSRILGAHHARVLLYRWLAPRNEGHPAANALDCAIIPLSQIRPLHAPPPARNVGISTVKPPSVLTCRGSPRIHAGERGPLARARHKGLGFGVGFSRGSCHRLLPARRRACPPYKLLP
jgi:hypothetical protein